MREALAACHPGGDLNEFALLARPRLSGCSVYHASRFLFMSVRPSASFLSQFYDRHLPLAAIPFQRAHAPLRRAALKRGAGVVFRGSPSQTPATIHVARGTMPPHPELDKSGRSPRLRVDGVCGRRWKKNMLADDVKGGGRTPALAVSPILPVHLVSLWDGDVSQDNTS